MTPWGEYLSQLLDERDLSLRSFAALVGEEPSFVSRAMRGVLQYKNGPTVKPPLAKVEAWAEALQLAGADRDRFIELAELAHAPDGLAQRYLALKARMAKYDERLRKFEDERRK